MIGVIIRSVVTAALILLIILGLAKLLGCPDRILPVSVNYDGAITGIGNGCDN